MRAPEIHTLLREMAPPYPGAYSELRGQRLRILRTRLLEEKVPLAAAQLRVSEGRLLAECADGGILRIVDCELDGAPLDAALFSKRFGREPVALGEAA